MSLSFFICIMQERIPRSHACGRAQLSCSSRAWPRSQPPGRLHLLPAPTPGAFQRSWWLGTDHPSHCPWVGVSANSLKDPGNVCHPPCGVCLLCRVICSLACKMRGDSQHRGGWTDPFISLLGGSPQPRAKPLLPVKLPLIFRSLSAAMEGWVLKS